MEGDGFRLSGLARWNAPEYVGVTLWRDIDYFGMVCWQADQALNLVSVGSIPAPEAFVGLL